MSEHYESQLKRQLAEARERIALLEAGVQERQDMLEQARDLLEEYGAHGDDWPAIAPAIERLLARLAGAEAGRARFRVAWRSARARARGRQDSAERAEYAEARVVEQAAALQPTEEALTRVMRVAEAWPVEVRQQAHDAIDGRGDGPAGHVYLSTGCFHGEHGYCQGATGAVGAKEPAKCKFCPAPCRCACHADKRTA